MKYFTKELWAGVNGRGKYKEREAHEIWDRNLEAYTRQLELVRPRLSEESYRFFANESLHDGRLLAFIAGDGIDHDIHRSARFDINARNTSVRLKVLNAELNALYTLDYTEVRRVLFDFPSHRPLFHREGDHIADWGYDELTAPDEKYLRHEVLFSSGATILVEFKVFSWRRESCAGTRYPERT